MPSIPRLHSLLLIAGLAGCAHVVDAPPPAPRIPLIESLLIAGDSIATIRVRVLDSTGGGQVGAPAAGAVALELTGPGGRRAPLTQDPASSDLFQARISIEPGGRYRLTGTVADQAIDATTVVPVVFIIDEPVSDTVDVAPSLPGAGAFRFQWRLQGATVVVADSARFPPGYPTSHAMEGTLILEARPLGTIGPAVTLWALNLDAERYLVGNAVPATNVTGGHGVLGGAIRRSRVIRWR